MKSFLKSNKLNYLLLFLILSLAAVLRFYGLNWDQNQHLHPDERFLTMVVMAIKWPLNMSDFLNTDKSPLNPHNQKFSFYVYGTFPLFLTKAVADLLNKSDYNTLTTTGRSLAAILDLGTTLVVYLITQKITKNKLTALLSMFLYSVSVVPIQLSHYFTVDPYLTFFIALSFYFSLFIKDKRKYKEKVIFSIICGISFGLAFASKLQAFFFLPILLSGIFLYSLNRKFIRTFVVLSFFAISSLFSIRINQPYLFSGDNFFSLRINPKVINNWKELNFQYSDQTYKNTNSIYFPPAIMFINTKDYIFPLKNIILWGSGLPLGLTTFAAIIFLSVKFGLKFKDPDSLSYIFILAWVIFYFVYQAQLFAKYLRYFYILYPFFSIISAIFLHMIYKIKAVKIITFLVPFFTLIWASSFVTIYSRKHTRIEASEYIYENIPFGSTISYEHWDDTLPLCLPSYPCGDAFHQVEFPLYDQDNNEKWEKIQKKIDETDYIILSSNRLYGSITTVPEIYPLANKFYEKLFNGSLGYEVIASFSSRPNIPLPIKGVCMTPPWIWYGKVARQVQDCTEEGISFVDDYADESFTVYDHPKVIIFKKVKPNSSV